MWKGLYNHVEKSTPPRQSPADFLSAVREQSQQLEEELTNHQEVPPGGTAHHHLHPGSRQGIQHTNTNKHFLLWHHHNPQFNIHLSKMTLRISPWWLNTTSPSLNSLVPFVPSSKHKTKKVRTRFCPYDHISLVSRSSSYIHISPPNPPNIHSEESLFTMLINEWKS